MVDRERIFEDYDGRAIVSFDLVQKILPHLNRNYIIRPDGKIVPIIRAKSPDPPWVYVRSHPGLNCTMWHEVLFNALGIFPEQCLECWKVVIRPRTVEELVVLLEVEENLTKRSCKCGIEVRPYVNQFYGGYFYCRSMEDGLDCLDEVRALVAENIGPGVPVFLKRYCTEFELRFGPSDAVEETLARGYFIHPDRGKVSVMPAGAMQTWRSAAEQAFDLMPDTLPCDCQSFDMPIACEKCFGTGRMAVPQPIYVKQHVIRTWFEYAWASGDMTVKKFFGGDDLYTPSRHYERGDLPPGEVCV